MEDVVVLETKEYITGIFLMVAAAIVAFLVTNNNETDTLTVVLQSGLIGLVCGAGYLSGRFINARGERKKNVKTKSKKAMKREARGK